MKMKTNLNEHIGKVKRTEIEQSIAEYNTKTNNLLACVEYLNACRKQGQDEPITIRTDSPVAAKYLQSLGLKNTKITLLETGTGEPMVIIKPTHETSDDAGEKFETLLEHLNDTLQQLDRTLQLLADGRAKHTAKPWDNDHFAIIGNRALVLETNGKGGNQ